MKRVSFIRHGALEAPFDNYDNASLALLDNLATQAVMPSIDFAKAHIKPVTSDRLQLNKTEVLLHASSLRAQQTAGVVASQCNYRVPLVATPLLNEMLFSPLTLVTPTEYEQQGMPLIRERLFLASVQATPGAEPITNVYARLARLTELVQSRPEANITLVTHGFFMRYLQLYFLEGRRNAANITVQDLARQTNYPNLEGFSAQVQ